MTEVMFLVYVYTGAGGLQGDKGYRERSLGGEVYRGTYVIG
jgi:hypothetical protein